MSSLTLGGLGKGGSTGVGSSSSLGGKAGGGAEKLKKAFGVVGRPSTEKVPESVLTAEEKEIRLEAEFDGTLRSFPSFNVWRSRRVENRA